MRKVCKECGESKNLRECNSPEHKEMGHKGKHYFCCIPGYHAELVTVEQFKEIDKILNKLK